MKKERTTQTSVDGRETSATKRRPHLTSVVIAAINVVLFAAICACLLTYANVNNKISNQQNIDSIISLAGAKAELVQTELDTSGEAVISAYNYCNGKTVNEALDYLALITDGRETEFQLVKRNWDELLETEFIGYSSKATDEHDYVALEYSNTPLAYALEKYGEDARALSYSPRFTNSIDSFAYYASYRGITLLDEGVETDYILLNPQKCDVFLAKLDLSSQYEHLSTAVIDADGNYLAGDSVYKGRNFYNYIYDFNKLSIDQKNALQQSLLDNDDGYGTVEYEDSKYRECVFAYSECNTFDDWYVIVSVPLADFSSRQFMSPYTISIIGILLGLFAIDAVVLLSNNKKLRISVAKTNRAIAEADAANEAKGSFLAHMSHEMRTPLNAIIGMEKLAEDKLAAEKVKSPDVEMFLSKINVASTHLLNIINDVLDFSKIGEGKLTIHNEEFSLEDLYKAIAIIYNITAKDKSISLQFDYDVDTDHYLIGDEMRLRQIIVNLISNAIKYNNKGGFVKVRILQQGEVVDNRMTVRFEVEDNGFGISPEKLKTMFEPFTRDYTDKTKSISGTGLGLAISLQLANLMESEIHAESELDKGSRFWFDINFQIGGKIIPKNEDDGAADWNSETLKGVHILMAEDNEMNAYIAQTLLKNVGAEVDVAVNGKVAVEMFKDSEVGTYDIILMDILMPVMDGYEATRAIQSIGTEYAKNIPIVALSANAFREDVEKSIANGMVGHLLKPIDLNALYKTVMELTINKDVK